ncbi:4-diphosphocytidyl-2-C-methyl-D-erythritol kinase [Salsuginibacillus halophilus]|uniref:4-diphosphocytidyl-2-C-methyl-D-erythritol kinase n=1 Tax=Salsuginibacillus halophilus TaxID=517424 RepID=A0A2P8H7S5_9BACI|nr:4-(cytidine 5'-diphospho)-2-C-methyl-D-erythritol kinase [Salsuginibacillus halophilus]PSL42249.1 4-diphosphocytidyl-2-C-methyl-D-erythritol kinase [Salsuginibacillus halophilus]
MKCSLRAPAKINLSLDVLHKRPDNFHEVAMVMTQVDLADRVELTRSESSQIRLSVSAGLLPEDHRNLAIQAARLLQKRYDVTAGASIFIDKKIPVAAGLAGGSSDAAAVLKGLNELWELNIPLEKLAALGSEIGSDVSFCVHGGTALATGRGEVIEPIAAPPAAWVVLAKPPVGLSTGDIYKQMKPNPEKEPVSNKMVEAIESGDYKAMCRLLSNDLESVTLASYPEVRQIKDRMIESGVDAALMSGSGPTVFGLVEKESRVHRVYNALRGFCEDVHAVRLL